MREQGGCRLNVSGVLRHLGVSRSGYNTWKNRIPSNQEQRKNKIKDKNTKIYLMRSLILIPLMRYGVQILHIFGLMKDLYI